jgi:hypothetical protein
MASVVISGNTSGSVTLSAPTVAGSSTQTLVAETGTLAPIVSGTAVASTSGTVIDYTGIPSWVKRITVMFHNVSLNTTTGFLVQIGTGTVVSSGYNAISNEFNQSNATSGIASTAGFPLRSQLASTSLSAVLTLNSLGNNTWASSHSGIISNTNAITGGGSVTISGALDIVRITSISGTATFDAGSINIMYE